MTDAATPSTLPPQPMYPPPSPPTVADKDVVLKDESTVADIGITERVGALHVGSSSVIDDHSHNMVEGGTVSGSTVQELVTTDGSDRVGVYTGQVVNVSTTNSHVPHGNGCMLYNVRNDTKICKYDGGWNDGFWHGRGTLLTQQGDTYSGDFVRGHRQGQGVYEWADGRKYSGQFVHDQRHGPGSYAWPNGATYNGSFVKNIRHGYGSYHDPNAYVQYSGDWQNGMYHGYGLYQWRTQQANPTSVSNSGSNVEANESATHQYRGHFIDGKPHGEGVELYPDGSVRHNGEWKNGEPVYKESVSKLPQDNVVVQKPAKTKKRRDNTVVVSSQQWWDASCQSLATYRGLWNADVKVPVGNGTAEYSNGPQLSYEGCFSLDDGLYHGQGRLIWRNGDSYHGEFELGQRHGKGSYYWKDGRHYKGQYEHNHRHGRGTYVYTNSSFYEGEFVQSQRHGKGRFVFEDGTSYDGSWEDGQYHGHGVLVYANGQTYTGEFAEGVAHGQGILVDVNGKTVYEGEWRWGGRGDEEPVTQSIVPLSQDLAPSIQASSCIDPASPVLEAPANLQKVMPQSVLESRFSAPPPVAKRNSGNKIYRPASPSKHDDDCVAVVDQAVTDGQGNPGKYTGLVDKASRQPHGVGRMVYNDGKRIHEGFWVYGSKEGQGRCLFFPQNDFHMGEYKHNLRHGPGRYEWKDGRLYVGEYLNDLRHGQGTFTYPTGEKYEGYFDKGQRSGFGIFEFDEGRYEGQWQAGRYHGEGKLVWKNGCGYEGQFMQGVFHGKGSRRDESGSIVQSGFWRMGVYCDDIDTDRGQQSDGSSIDSSILNKNGIENVNKNDIVALDYSPHGDIVQEDASLEEKKTDAL